MQLIIESDKELFLLCLTYCCRRLLPTAALRLRLMQSGRLSRAKWLWAKVGSGRHPATLHDSSCSSTVQARVQKDRSWT
jgi:hypothetical protein